MNKQTIAVRWNSEGLPCAIENPQDAQQMNWLSSHYQTGAVRGFCTKSCQKTANGVLVQAQSPQGVQLCINRRVLAHAYVESYTFLNKGPQTVTLNQSFGAVSYAGSSFFNKQPNMLQTRCNTHIFAGGAVAYLYSMRLCGKPPYLLVRATKGSFSGYGLAADIAQTPNASFDRGQIWLFPTPQALQPGGQAVFTLRYSFVSRRPEQRGFHCTLSKYSLLPGEQARLTVHNTRPITALAVTCNGRAVNMQINGAKAVGIIAPKQAGEYTIEVTANGQKTGRLVCNADFPDRNAARERLAMGVTVALALQHENRPALKKSLALYRSFLEREIVNIHTGEVKNGVGDDRTRLYNYPWVSTFYTELYRSSGDVAALKTAADVLIHYYSIGGEEMESHLEVHRLLPCLKKQGLTKRYNALLAGLLKHADSIVARRTDSSSTEVSCANGMMSMMGVILMDAYRLTQNKKYLAPLPDLADIVGNFYALQPDFHCYGMAVRYWDLYWFGEAQLYGDTFPQWLCANTAEFYRFYDKTLHSKAHARLIREILLGCCCVYEKSGFGACGYLYPDEVIAYSSDPACREPHRPIKHQAGKFYDAFANDQDWSLYYAFTLLPKKYLK